MHVITLQTPSGEKLRVSMKQASVMDMRESLPRAESGDWFCLSAGGPVLGDPSLSDDDFLDFIQPTYLDQDASILPGAEVFYPATRSDSGIRSGKVIKVVGSEVFVRSDDGAEIGVPRDAIRLSFIRPLDALSSETDSPGPLSARQAAADDAFASFDFGDGVDCVDANGWDFSGPLDWTRVVYLEFDDDDASASTRAFFHARFTEQGDLDEVYALLADSGDFIGHQG